VKSLLVCAAMLMAASAAMSQRASVPSKVPNKPLIVVAADTIDSHAIATELGIDSCRGQSDRTNSRAAVELLQQVIEHAVLHSLDPKEIGQADLQLARATLYKNSRDTSTLHCMERADSTLFLKNVVREPMIREQLQNVFLHDPSVHRPAKDSIAEIFDALHKNPATFFEFVHDTEIFIRIADPGRPKPGAPGFERPYIPPFGPGGRPLPPVSADSLPLVKNVLSKLAPHQIWPHVLETGQAYGIVMLDTVTDSLYSAIFIRISKPAYEGWFRQYVLSHLKIKFLDAALEADVRRQYSTAWWLRAIK
jgi:hypothetical protein